MKFRPRIIKSACRHSCPCQPVLLQHTLKCWNTANFETCQYTRTVSFSTRPFMIGGRETGQPLEGWRSKWRKQEDNWRVTIACPQFSERGMKQMMAGAKPPSPASGRHQQSGPSGVPPSQLPYRSLAVRRRCWSAKSPAYPNAKDACLNRHAPSGGGVNGMGFPVAGSIQPAWKPGPARGHDEDQSLMRRKNPA